MYIDQNLANQYGLNFQNPTVQMMCGAQSPHMFSSAGYQSMPGYNYQQPMIGCYSFGNPSAGYFQQQAMYQQNGQINPFSPHSQYISSYMSNMLNQNPVQQQYNPNPGGFSAYSSGPSNNPYLNYMQYSPNANPMTCSNPYYADTTNMDIHQKEMYEYDKLKQMYEEGKITPSQYAAYANAGIEHTTESGTHVYATNNYPQYSGWGGVSFGFNNQDYIRRQQEQQELAYQNQLAFDIARKINNKFFGISEEEAIQTQIQKEQYERSLNERRRQESEIEYTYDMFAEQFKGAVYSDEKGYMSPRKEQAYRQFNNIWNSRHKNFKENYTMKDFMENGVYADIIFGDMQYDMDRRRHNLVRMYDEIFVKNSINTMSPFYDPNGGFSLKGFKINKNELEIELPPELIKQDYQNRKNTFFSSIFNNKTENLPSDEAYLRYRYSNPEPVNITQKLQL